MTENTSPSQPKPRVPSQEAARNFIAQMNLPLHTPEAAREIMNGWFGYSSGMTDLALDAPHRVAGCDSCIAPAHRRVLRGVGRVLRKIRSLAPGATPEKIVAACTSEELVTAALGLAMDRAATSRDRKILYDVLAQMPPRDTGGSVLAAAWRRIAALYPAQAPAHLTSDTAIDRAAMLRLIDDTLDCLMNVKPLQERIIERHIDPGALDDCCHALAHIVTALAIELELHAKETKHGNIDDTPRAKRHARS